MTTTAAICWYQVSCCLVVVLFCFITEPGGGGGRRYVVDAWMPAQQMHHANHASTTAQLGRFVVTIQSDWKQRSSSNSVSSRVAASSFSRRRYVRATTTHIQPLPPRAAQLRMSLSSSSNDDNNNNDGIQTIAVASSSNNWNEQLDRILASPPPSPPTTSPSTDTTTTMAPLTRLRHAVKWLRESPDKAIGGENASMLPTTQSSLTKSNWDSIFLAIEEVTAAESYQLEDMIQKQQQQAMSTGSKSTTIFPVVSTARNDMVDLYQALADRGDLRLYGAITTTTPPAAGSNQVSKALLEEILNLPMSALSPKPTNTFLVAGTVVALLEILLSIATGISFNAIVLTTLFLATIDRLFLNGAVLESCLQVFSPGIRDKIIRHEAGHFVAAYLLGCPLEGIVLSAWAALKDERFGRRHVSAGTSFFDPQLSQQINSNSGVTRASIDRYSIIVMAGIAAEADYFGQADGGASDELALVAFLSRLNGNRRGVVQWDSEAIRNQARWGALQAVLLLRQYQPAYDAVVDALQRGGRLGDCIYALERAARHNNLPTRVDRQPLGYMIQDPMTGNWMWSNSTGSTATDAVPSIAAIASAEAAMVNGATTTSVFDPTKAQQSLQEYRTQVEEQLQTVQEKLKQWDKD